MLTIVEERILAVKVRLEFVRDILAVKIKILMKPVAVGFMSIKKKPSSRPAFQIQDI